MGKVVLFAYFVVRCRDGLSKFSGFCDENHFCDVKNWAVINRFGSKEGADAKDTQKRTRCVCLDSS